MLQTDVLPDVKLRPVRQGEHADALALVDARIVDVPQLRTLVLRIPLVELVAEGEDALLGTALLFIAAGTAESGIEAVFVEGLEQGLRLHEVGVYFRAVGEGSHAGFERLLVALHNELPPVFVGVPVAEGKHLLEFPFRVDVHQGEGWPAGCKGFLCQPHHHAGILADAVKHHGIFKLRRHFADDVYGLCFELLQVAQTIVLCHCVQTL